MKIEMKGKYGEHLCVSIEVKDKDDTAEVFTAVNQKARQWAPRHARSFTAEQQEATAYGHGYRIHLNVSYYTQKTEGQELL